MLPVPTPIAEVIADSISPEGIRLTTVLATGHRFILAELNTHRVFSRNSASSRAIPFSKQLDRFENDPWWPVEWPNEQPGMQGGDELTGDPLQNAQDALAAIHMSTEMILRKYLDDHPDPAQRLHKSLLNRPMEWAQSHTVLITSTYWQGYIDQRCHPAAQPEKRVLAEAIRDALVASTPVELGSGEWHMPFILDEDRSRLSLRQLCEVSSARCARTSYVNFLGSRDVQLDLDLYQRLAGQWPMHASPLEHVATPDGDNASMAQVYDFSGMFIGERIVPKLGNLCGWRQFRHIVEGERGLYMGASALGNLKGASA